MTTLTYEPQAETLIQKPFCNRNSLSQSADLSKTSSAKSKINILWHKFRPFITLLNQYAQNVIVLLQGIGTVKCEQFPNSQIASGTTPLKITHL